MILGRIAFAGAMLAAAMLGTAVTTAVADQNYVPRGHAYGPGLERLPPLNSRQDRIHSQADVYEAEIRQRQLELRIQQERIRQHLDLDLNRPGRSYFDY